MADCIILSEPSAIVVGDQILLAVGCVSLPASTRIELLASSDHAATFTRVGTLVSTDDAANLGAPATRVNAPHLFDAGGVTHALVSPGNASGSYLGCALLELDPSHAIVRDGNGAPHVARFFDAPGQPQRGACAAAEGATGTGVVMNIPTLTPTPLWRVFHTGVSGL
jgi:hypothetical protein